MSPILESMREWSPIYLRLHRYPWRLRLDALGGGIPD